MYDRYLCDHAWIVDHVDTTGEEQDQQGRRVARLMSKYWLCRTCGATNVTVTPEEVGDMAHDGHESS